MLILVSIMTACSVSHPPTQPTKSPKGTWLHPRGDPAAMPNIGLVSSQLWCKNQGLISQSSEPHQMVLDCVTVGLDTMNKTVHIFIEYHLHVWVYYYVGISRQDSGGIGTVKHTCIRLPLNLNLNLYAGLFHSSLVTCTCTYRVSKNARVT